VSYSSRLGISLGFRVCLILAATIFLTSFALADSGDLTVGPSSINFGSVAVGSSQTQALTLTNSGSKKLMVLLATPSGTCFSFGGLTLPVMLNPGQSVSGSVTFAPQSTGSSSGTVAFRTKHYESAAVVASLTVAGTGVAGGQLASAPTSLSFGTVTTGSTASLTETLTNSGASAVTISQIAASGTGFAVSGISLPVALNPAQSVGFTVSFTPQSAGSASGSVAVTSSAPNLAIALSGTGSLPGQLSITPASVNFGSVTIGKTQSQAASLTASNAQVTVSSVGVSGSQFSVSGISLPVTIAAGSSASFAVNYAPTTSGAGSANVTFVSNAGNVVESLAGSGVAPQHSVTLGWNTSTSSDVAGYNIYRATSQTGSYTKLNAQLDAAPYDTDSAVQAGATYYYAVTAVSTTGTESTYSNQIQVVIPTP
jgi:hypothetical protein